MNDNAFIIVATKAKAGRFPVFRLCVCLGTVLLVLATGAAASDPPPDDSRPFRLAFSASLFTEVNEADIRAAMKVWIMTIVKDLSIAVDPDPNIQPTVAAMAEFGITHQVDGFAVITPELVHLGREMPFDRFAVGTTDGRFGDEYLILVHRDSGIQRLDQLQGVDITVLDHPRMSLAMIWLETCLLRERLGLATDFFSRVNTNAKTSQVVLPVFFRKHASCLISRAGFEIMAELNPQLNQQLRILAVSPTFVSTGFAFRADTISPARPKILAALAKVENHPAGRQMLTLLIQSEAMADHPISILDESLAWIAEHRRLRGMQTQRPLEAQATQPMSIIRE